MRLRSACSGTATAAAVVAAGLRRGVLRVAGTNRLILLSTLLAATTTTTTATRTSAAAATLIGAPWSRTFRSALFRTFGARASLRFCCGLLLLSRLTRFTLIAISTAGVAIRVTLAAAAAPVTRRTATATVASVAAVHIKLGTVLECVLANGGAHFGASRADAKKSAARMMKYFYLDTVATDSQLIQRDLNCFVDSDALRFDTIRHAKGLS
jgi:hypothetical protein